MSIGLLGKKIGMTRIYDASGKLRPVTVIAAGDNTLLRRLTSENDGYSAIQVGFDAQKEQRVTKPLLGDFTKAGSEPKKFVREFRLAADAPEGEIDLAVTQFQPGDWVDVDRPVQGQRLPGRDEEAQLRTARARRTVRRRTAATAPSAIVPPRAAFGRTWACRVTWATSA